MGSAVETGWGLVVELSPNIASSSNLSSELETMSSNKSSTHLSVDFVDKLERAGEGLTLHAGGIEGVACTQGTLEAPLSVKVGFAMDVVAVAVCSDVCASTLREGT